MEPTCPYLEGSDFCRKLESISSQSRQKYVAQYCQGDFAACARYRVASALGYDAVPKAMLPTETDRASRLIEQA